MQQTTLHLLCFEAKKAQGKSVESRKTWNFDFIGVWPPWLGLCFQNCKHSTVLIILYAQKNFQSKQISMNEESSANLLCVQFFLKTRQSSCVNTRGIPSAAWQVLLCCPIKGGYPISGQGGTLSLAGGTPSLAGDTPFLAWGTPWKEPGTGNPLWKGHGTSGSIMGWRWGSPPPPPNGGQTEKITSRCTSYAGGNNIEAKIKILARGEGSMRKFYHSLLRSSHLLIVNWKLANLGAPLRTRLFSNSEGFSEHFILCSMLACHPPPPSAKNPGSAPRNLDDFMFNFIHYDGLVSVSRTLRGIRGPKTPLM